jgi:hypothetical protein
MATAQEEANYIFGQLSLVLATPPEPGKCRCMCGIHKEGFCSSEATSSRSFTKYDGEAVTVPMCDHCSAAIDARVERLVEGTRFS